MERVWFNHIMLHATAKKGSPVIEIAKDLSRLANLHGHAFAVNVNGRPLHVFPGEPPEKAVAGYNELVLKEASYNRT